MSKNEGIPAFKPRLEDAAYYESVVLTTTIFNIVFNSSYWSLDICVKAVAVVKRAYVFA